ncbi:MAG: hypothetical protein ACYCZC_10120 [Acidithiobacillus sp.]
MMLRGRVGGAGPDLLPALSQGGGQGSGWGTETVSATLQEALALEVVAPGEQQRRNGVLPESPPDFGVTAEMGR